MKPKMNKKLYFLCGYFENLSFIYGVKDKGDWHYFEEADSIIDEHGSLPADLRSCIRNLRTVSAIPISLDASQVANYVINDKFVFKGKELETFLRISGRSSPKKGPSSDDLVFIDGETNPSIFLDRFAKCKDVKTDRDKLYKIRHFVNDEHKPEFSKLFFKGDWEAARDEFLKKYSYSFTENKRKALDFQFKGDSSLRSFVQRKMIAYSTYTCLKLNSQLEVILAELPSEISCLFVRHLKISATKLEILEFCDYIQEFVDEGQSSEESGNRTLTNQFQQQQQRQMTVAQDLETFDCTSSDDQTEYESCDDRSSISSKSSTVSRKRGRNMGTRDRGRPPKIVKVIAEGDE